MAKSHAALPDGVEEQPLDLDALSRAHAALVKRWAQRLGGPGIDVEDVVHEVFLVAHRRLALFRSGGNVSTWLYRTTVHVTHKQRRKQRLGRWLRGLAGQFTDDVGSPDAGPHETLERQRASRLVYRALDGLNQNQRSVVILYELEGLSGEEIAAVMETKVGTVWVWLHRGRAKFLERLKALDQEAIR